MKACATFFAMLLACGSAFAFDPFHEARIEQRAGAQIPLDLVFRDESGAPMTLRTAAQGKPMLLAPVLHRCPNICGLTLAGLAEAVTVQKFVAGQDFGIVAFGIDPREGTAEAASSIEELRHTFPNLSPDGVHGLTGSLADIDAVTQALGYRYVWDKEVGQYAHIAAVAVLTPDGRLSRWLYGLMPDPGDLRLALTEAGQGRIGTWSDQLLLLCYHYDPQTGRYGLMIWTLLRLAGGATVLLGGGVIGLALLRERRKTGRGAT
jgi:protein SCO1/2